jgi:Fic family protein
VHEMNDALNDFEKFIHADDEMLTIIKAALLHAQFEIIHPFLDGNGRTGRMLITFYLWQEKILEKPVLFLSSFFKKHQKLYYERLFEYGQGNVDSWIDFFLEGMIEIANEAINTVEKITILRDEDRLKIDNLGKRASKSASSILPKLYSQPIINASIMMKWTGFTRAGAQRVIDRFMEMDILALKNQDTKYGQSYMYKKYLDIFKE